MIRLTKRLVYFVYYLRQLDRAKLDLFMAHVEQTNGWSRARQWRRILWDSLRFNISILEYYQFRFFALSDNDKRAWAGTGFMYEFQKKANPPRSRAVLADKCLFHQVYRDYVRHDVASVWELEEQPGLAEQLLEKHDVLVFKPADGNCGTGIEFIRSQALNARQLTLWMRGNGFDLVEERVSQHPDMSALSPAGVNTVRIVTCLDSHNRCRLIGCRLRITVNSNVDNLAAGNVAAPIDERTGRVSGPGVYADMTRKPIHTHPVTGVSIPGFEVPYWAETVALIREASERYPQNRSVGWDIVITPDGPGLIEGNHDWCKLVWQLPVQRGLKGLLQTCECHV